MVNDLIHNHHGVTIIINLGVDVLSNDVGVVSLNRSILQFNLIDGSVQQWVAVGLSNQFTVGVSRSPHNLAIGKGVSTLWDPNLS